MKNKRKNIKVNEITSLLVTLIIIVLINIIGSFVFTRFDLTSEKRYTLSDTSKDILKNLDDYVYFRVYLDGEFPAKFKKLRKETKEMLDEFRAYSKFIDYEFINPSESNNETERMDSYRTLYQSGLEPVDEIVQSNNGIQQIRIWPGIIMSYGEQETPINLLASGNDMTHNASAQDLNASAQDLEYKLISSIFDAIHPKRQSLAFTTGHGELEDPEVYDLVKSLRTKYSVSRVTLNEQLNSLMKKNCDTLGNILSIRPAYNAIVIAKPTMPFSEKDKFLIDQFIMYGGKVMWLLDPVNTSMDSLKDSESTMGLALDLNLDDQLFKYGIKLNRNILCDNACAQIGIASGQKNHSQVYLMPWCYFPLLRPASNHPIVRNLDPVKADFVSSLDTTTSSPKIRKIPLLKTSEYTKVASAPVFISLEIIGQHIQLLTNGTEAQARAMFPDKKGKIAAYLLNGKFHSFYENRIPVSLSEAQEIGFKTESPNTSMIVIADGDIIRNQFANLDYAKKNGYSVGTPLTLGYDQYTNILYGNKRFIENSISYLLEGEGLINIRSRELKIRLLNDHKVKSNTVMLQLVNVVLPSAIMIVLGIILTFLRKKKYTNN